MSASPREGRSEARVRIVGDHPHRGATGTVRDDGRVAFGMLRVDLDSGALADACFAGPENLQSLPPSEDPYA